MLTSSSSVTSWRDPGVIPRDLDPDPPCSAGDGNPLDPEDPLAIPLPRIVRVPQGADLKVKWCETCGTYRPPRASHCRTCDNCVENIGASAAPVMRRWRALTGGGQIITAPFSTRASDGATTSPSLPFSALPFWRACSRACSARCISTSSRGRPTTCCRGAALAKDTTSEAHWHMRRSARLCSCCPSAHSCRSARSGATTCIWCR